MNINDITYYKNLYDKHRLIHIVFYKDEFLFRTITRKEYKELYLSSHDKYELQERMCQLTCVYPEEYDFSMGLAGLPEIASDRIEEVSGFKDVTIPIKWYQQELNNVTMENQCMDLIKAFMPEYTYEEMEDWTWEHLAKVTARASRIAKYHGYDWHLEDKSEEFTENINKMSSDNKEFVHELYINGVDPMLYFKTEVEELLKTKIIDFPIITSGRWYDEELLSAVRRQGFSS